MEITDLQSASVKQISVRKVNGSTSSSFPDILAVEEPLEIRINYGPACQRLQKNISVTMRTPGNDLELAIGFLFTEGIITSYDDVEEVDLVVNEHRAQKQNITEVELVPGRIPMLMQAERNFYTTSSCGICGKSSIQSIRTVSSFGDLRKPPLALSPEVLYQLPGKLRAAQSNFSATGGIHASGLFTHEGDLVLMREDVGRHNALDKLIGTALANQLLPLDQYVLLLSGRASFELIQKSAMAGVSVVAAIGAPSSLAVDLAKECDITLLGFLKHDRFNIYYSSERILIPTDEN